jgi:hypothetical protein
MPYPMYHGFIERLARKVVTRVIKDGIALDQSIKEVIHFADLDRQQTLYLCSVLQDYNMPYNGDPNNYFFTEKEMGKDFPNTQNGYVVYASDQNKMKKIFAAMDRLKKAGISDDGLMDMNPFLEDLIAIANSYKEKAHEIATGLENQEVSQEENELALAAKDNSKKVTAAENAEVEKANVENVQNLLEEPKDDLTVEDEPQEKGVDLDLGDSSAGDDLTVDDSDASMDLGGEVKATIKPSPSELMEEVKSAPKWDVKNMLSISKAESFYKGLKEQLEAVIYNENIDVDMELLNQYDKVRQHIDSELDKISDAQKEKDKLEEKETDLEQEFNEGEEKPTEEMIVQDENAPEGETDLGGEKPSLEEISNEKPTASEIVGK